MSLTKHYTILQTYIVHVNVLTYHALLTMLLTRWRGKKEREEEKEKEEGKEEEEEERRRVHFGAIEDGRRRSAKVKIFKAISDNFWTHSSQVARRSFCVRLGKSAGL